jgi:hypothetical protein
LARLLLGLPVLRLPRALLCCKPALLQFPLLYCLVLLHVLLQLLPPSSKLYHLLLLLWRPALCLCLQSCDCCLQLCNRRLGDALLLLLLLLRMLLLLLLLLLQMLLLLKPLPF